MCYCNGMETYELIRSGRKTLALEITRDCRVVVRAPRRLSQEKARQVLPPKITYYSEKMGLFPTGVRITSARTRYGSCSGKNSLCFSCFLMNCPDAAMDLVVVHELCHIQVKNHGPDFYALLEQVLPDWRERKKLLR